MLAHGVHLGEDELCRCHESGTALAHCPTSNLFLGSGLFRIGAAKDPRRPVQVGLGTDIGGGTSFSLLATMGAAYEIAQLSGRTLSAVEAFYLATLGGARALALDDRIGTIAPGHEADFVVLDPNATPLLTLRNARAESVEDVLFALMMLGDDRAVRATYVAGKLRTCAPHDRLARAAFESASRERRSAGEVLDCEHHERDAPRPGRRERPGPAVPAARRSRACRRAAGAPVEDVGKYAAARSRTIIASA